jgi:hypothetical protein
MTKRFAILVLLLLCRGLSGSGNRGAVGAASSDPAAAGDRPPHSAALSSQAPPLIGKKADEQADSLSRRAKPTRSITPTNGPIKPLLDDLKAKVTAGDDAAALQLYVDLQTCRDVLKRGEEFTRMKGQNIPEEIRESTRESIARELDNCRGIGIEETGDILKWLEMAAQRGNAQAQIMWIDSYLDERGGSVWMIQHPEDIQAYKQQAMNYLNDLAGRCSPDALSMLFWEYSSKGILTKKNSYLAYKYAILYNKISPGSIRESELSDLSRQLSSAQVQELNDSANAFHRSHCE